MDRQRVQEAGLSSEVEVIDKLINDIQVVVDELREQDMPQSDNSKPARLPPDDTSTQVLRAAERQLEEVRANLKEAYMEFEYWRVRVHDLERVERVLDTVRTEMESRDSTYASGAGVPTIPRY